MFDAVKLQAQDARGGLSKDDAGTLERVHVSQSETASAFAVSKRTKMMLVR
ncbi:MAG: hypothetical protein K8R46_05215 [Pirellulales bacterium]|nr:hypothetical protein [Pirellulales bacterium]